MSEPGRAAAHRASRGRGAPASTKQRDSRSAAAGRSRLLLGAGCGCVIEPERLALGGDRTRSAVTGPVADAASFVSPDTVEAGNLPRKLAYRAGLSEIPSPSRRFRRAGGGRRGAGGSIRGEPVVRSPTEAIARRPTARSRGSTCASSGRCSRPPARGTTGERVANRSRASRVPNHVSDHAATGGARSLSRASPALRPRTSGSEMSPTRS